MINKKIILSTMALITCGMLAACGKDDGAVDNTAVTKETKVSAVSEKTTNETSKSNESETKKQSDDIRYDWASAPWTLYYPADVKTEFDYDCLFTYDVKNYMVTATHSYGQVDGDVESNTVQGILESLRSFELYSSPTLDTGYWPVTEENADLDVEHIVMDGVEYITRLKNLEGEHVEINGLDVYKFTAKMEAASAHSDCYVYGYSWQFPTQVDGREVRTYQYTIAGVVTALDQEPYISDMETLTDYIMNHSEMN